MGSVLAWMPDMMAAMEKFEVFLCVKDSMFDDSICTIGVWSNYSVDMFWTVMTSNDTGCARDNSSVQISYCFTDPEMTEVSDQVRMESQPSPSVPGSRGPILRH